MKESNPLRSKIAIIIIDNFDPIEGVLRADKATSAILKEVYEEVSKCVPDKREARNFDPDIDVTGLVWAGGQHGVAGYNKAVDQFKSNLKLLIGGKD